MALESISGQLFDPSFDSLSERTQTRNNDLNSLLSTVAQAIITPSATINTNGTALTATPPAPHATCRPFSCHGVVRAIGAETLTFTVTATNEDATTKTATATATAVGPWAITPANMATLFTAAKKISNIAVAVKSSIASSVASATAVVVVLNGG